MDIKKSNFLKDRFKLSSFSLRIYNANAGNRRYASVSSVRKGAKTHQIANHTRGFIENLCIRFGTCEVRRMNRSSIRQAQSNRTAESIQIHSSNFTRAEPNNQVRHM